MLCMKAAKDEMRKGPWTEQEDLQLVWFVRSLGERRWDLLAKVSGLNRTGKSCRLRWVNYLHPGLKRGRMTPEEEHLVLELHAKWGNRWSRIARRLPGRTDNEIKNYWRTHMRKKAQERKRDSSQSPMSTSSFSSSPSFSSNVFSSANEPAPSDQLGRDKLREAESGSRGEDMIDYSAVELQEVSDEGLKVYMDQLWNEIYAPAAVEQLSFDEFKDASASCAPPLPSPVWEDSLWRMDDEDFKISTQ